MELNIDLNFIKPFILIVEDREGGRNKYAKALRDINCGVITATNAKEAVNSFMTSPKLDLVFTDIDLKGKTHPDKSGVDIARFIKHLDNELPVVGYSSKFVDKELSEEEKGYFNRWFPKGDMLVKDILEMCDNLKDMANHHKLRRFNEVVDLFNKLKAKKIISNDQFGQVLETAITYDTTPFSQVEEAIAESGYSLKLLSSLVSDFISKPFLVWIRNDETLFEVEVYGYPDLYSFGNTEDEAIKNLIQIMQGYAADMKSDDADNFAGPALLLRKFLLYVIK